MIHVQYFKHLIYFFLWILECGADCPYKRCNCVGSEIECVDMGLSALELLNNNYSGFTHLYVSWNQITDIPAASFPPSLTDIDLLYNPLLNIDDTAFDESANTLTTLKLSSVRFTRIPDAFSHLKALKVLNIFQCSIEDWNNNAMRNIGQTLETLYLSNVGLKICPDWIRYFTKLTSLSIVDNSIAAIPDAIMDTLANTLVHLDLYNNSLTAVPQAISKFTALQELDLKINKISDISRLPRLSKLQSLFLNNNNISDSNGLSNALRPYAESLSSVYLQENSLTAIPSLDFLTKVSYFDLTNNKISDPSSGSVPPAVQSIDLSYNSLPYFPRFMSQITSEINIILPYNVVTKIQDVDFPVYAILVELGYNLITELTDTSFPQNSSIKFLHLNNNPIVGISYLSFRNLPALVELNLSSTKIARLPLGLAFLTRLTGLDISDSTDLVCTCQEKSLESWIRSMSVSNVDGQCGHVSIYDFFASLSPSCPER